MIEYQLPRGIMNYSTCFPLASYATKIINPFLDTRISANHDKMEGWWCQYGEIIIKGNKISYMYMYKLHKIK